MEQLLLHCGTGEGVGVFVGVAVAVGVGVAILKEREQLISDTGVPSSVGSAAAGLLDGTFGATA